MPQAKNSTDVSPRRPGAKEHDRVDHLTDSEATGRGASKTTKGDRTRKRILVAAGHHFARRGYSSVTLRDIADEVGITPAMIVRYFGSKRSLFDAVVDPESVDPIRGVMSPRERATRAVEYWQDRDTRSPVLALIRSLEVEDGELLRAAFERRVVAPLSDVIDGEDADVRLRIASGIGLGFGLFTIGLLLDPDQASLPPEEVERYIPYLTRILSVCLEPPSESAH